MPRPRRTAEPEIKDESLPGLDGLEQDPQPAAGRRRGRPPGSTTKKAAPKIRARTSTGRVMSGQQMKAQVATELYAFASMFVGIWGIRDPKCASVFTESVTTVHGEQERLAAIVEQTVELLARNDKVLAAMANAGLIGQIGMLGSLLMPVGKQIWKAHGPNGHGHAQAEEINYAQYPAPALA